MNGYEACAAIRKNQAGGSRPAIIAVTGWGQREDLRRSQEAGFDAHLVKPVDIAAIAAAVEDCLSEKDLQVSVPKRA